MFMTLDALLNKMFLNWMENEAKVYKRTLSGCLGSLEVPG